MNTNFNYVPRSLPEPSNLAERVATVLNGLRDVAAVHAGRNRVFVPMAILFSAYLSSVIRRFGSLAARLAAGPIPGRPTRHDRSSPTHDKATPKRRLPVRFAWVIEWLGYHAAGRSLQLRYLLADDPEMAALLAASPQGGRIFRPLCRMLGIKPAPDLPAALFLPRAAIPSASGASQSASAPPDPPEVAQSPELSSQALSLRSRTKAPRDAGADRHAVVKRIETEAAEPSDVLNPA